MASDAEAKELYRLAVEKAREDIGRKVKARRLHGKIEQREACR
jgi:hypothetical protein